MLLDALGTLDVGFGTTVAEVLANPARATKAEQGAVLTHFSTVILQKAMDAYELDAVAAGGDKKGAMISALLDVPALVEWRKVLATLAYPRPAAPAAGGGFTDESMVKLGKTIGATIAEEGARKRKEDDLKAAVGGGGGGGGSAGAGHRVTAADFDNALKKLPKPSSRALALYFPGRPLVPGFDQIQLEEVSAANPAEPAPGHGSKAVLVNIAPPAKMLAVRALVNLAGKGCDLGVRWAVDAFEFYPPAKCDFGAATAAVVNNVLQSSLEMELMRAVSPLSPTGRALLTAQVDCIKDAVTTATAALLKTEGNTADTAPILLFIFGNMLAASRVYMCPRGMDYDLSLYNPFRSWLQGEVVAIMGEQQLKMERRGRDTGAKGGGGGGGGYDGRNTIKDKNKGEGATGEGGKAPDWSPWCKKPDNRDTKCTKDKCPLHGPKRDNPFSRGRMVGHGREQCSALIAGKGGDYRECIKGDGPIKDYYTKHPAEKVPGEDQSFVDANRE